MHSIDGHHIEGTFTSADGLKLYYQSWHPKRQTRAVLGIVHGLGSHSGRFEKVASQLVPFGYSVYGFDLRGHGRSPGQRGYINRWDEYRDDFGQFWKLMVAQNSVAPCFVMGHSLGAIVVLDYALTYPGTVPGIIAMAPALKPIGVPPVRLMLGKLLSLVWPRFSLDTGIPQNAGSHDPTVLADYLSDPLRHRQGTARLVTEFFRTTNLIQVRLSGLQSAILALHGSDDSVALPECSRFLFESVPVIDKEYREYPGGYHDLHDDTIAQQVLNDLSNWLERHVNGELSFCHLRTNEMDVKPSFLQNA